MKLYLFMIILIIMNLGFISAGEVEIDCPSEVEKDEEFECDIEIFDFEGTYDLKIEIEKNEKSVAKIWDNEEEDWKSSYYYLKEFIESGELKEIELRIEEVGEYDGILKLRQNSKIEEFDFEIDVEEVDEAQESMDSQENGEESEEETFAQIKGGGENIATIEEIQNLPNIISLNSPRGDSKKIERVIYESKNKKILDYAPYFFLVFLVFLLIVILWDKF